MDCRERRIQSIVRLIGRGVIAGRLRPPWRTKQVFPASPQPSSPKSGAGSGIVPN
jgi:hypothetical protein